ncbi:VOC family protein [Roseateles sp. DC23W]|uniref:VOC family protein n=1 Tax=Pelomonas dachongensis TaxID=3299029 RepID=A0ABW7EFT3_9BURK
MQLNTARVFVKDLVSAKCFYANSLGLPLKVDGERAGYCVFGAGAMDLVIESVADDAPDEERLLVGRFTGLSFNVQDIRAAYAELLALGVVFSGEPERQAWGGTLATFADPAGNELQLVEQPDGR